MTILEYVESLDGDARTAAVKVLDYFSRPMTSREIEATLRSHGISKPRAAKVADAVKGMKIIAMIGDGHV